MMKGKKRIWLAAGVAVILPGSLFAQIFGGVFTDPIQSGHAVQQIAYDAKKLSQLIQTYRMIESQYNQMIYNAQWLTHKSAWLGIATQVLNSETPTLFGETATWNDAVTQQIGVPDAWSQATLAINVDPLYAGYGIGQTPESAAIASAEIADGMSQNAMASIAQSRMNQPLNDAALANLESDSQDTSDATNSEVGQLNLISNGSVLLNRQMQNQSSLLTTISEQQILMNKVKRDELADWLNQESARDLYLINEGGDWGSSAATITNYQQ